ncbi:MAG TPA: hypothetical protein VH331_01690 [Allosphingosinicella sp.]|jgi:hypothetical protein|nr:hypothetical protein [Allosphingosinicella sp.]
MRPLHIVLGAALALLSTMVSAQAQAPAQQLAAPPAQHPIWLVTDKDVGFTPVPIAFPLKAGVLSATRHSEASHAGENIDNMIEYRSADGAVFGTIYIYYPGLPHAGLAALAQDWAIRKNSNTPVIGGDLDLGRAGGVNGVAVRTAYSHYRGNLASAAAYIKQGRWIVTIRVSGPEARKADIDSAMQALLDGIQFGKSEPARIASRMTIRDCGDGDQHPAKILPDPTDASLAVKGILGTMDGGGIQGKDDQGDPAILPSRVPDELCRASLEVKGERYTLLRGADGEPISIDGRSVRLALLSDAGRLLEVDHAPKLGGYILLYHDLGETDVLGTYDSIPSDRQLAAILDGSDHEGGRVHIPVKLRPGHGAEVTLPQTSPGGNGDGRKPQPATSSR